MQILPWISGFTKTLESFDLTIVLFSKIMALVYRKSLHNIVWMQLCKFFFVLWFGFCWVQVAGITWVGGTMETRDVDLGVGCLRGWSARWTQPMGQEGQVLSRTEDILAVSAVEPEEQLTQQLLWLNNITHKVHTILSSLFGAKLRWIPIYSSVKKKSSNLAFYDVN